MKEGFRISYHDGMAMLTVYPREHRNKEIYADQVSNKMKLLQIPPVRMRIIEEILEKASGEAEELCAWPEGEQLSAHPEVTISADAMEARVRVNPPKPGGEEISREILHEALEEAGVKECLLTEELDRIVLSAIYNRPILIARGREPRKGVAAHIKYHFVTEKKPFKELRYGRIDLKELNFIQNRKPDDLLAELVQALPPEEGLNVLGEVLPAEKPGQDESLKIGENVRLEEGKVYAKIEGNVFLKQGAISMEPVVTVDNVDYRNGNIDFEGSVVVKGTVADGFSVKASGDIQCGKCVGRVTLYAGRNLMLKSGVNGDNEAVLSSGGDSWIRYIEGASLICKGNLLVQESVMHSQLSIWGNVLLSGGRAELIGGSLLVEGSLWCRKLGGLYETPTTVIIGLSPELLQEYSKLLLQMQKKRALLDEVDRSLEGLKRNGLSYDSHGNTVENLTGKARHLNEEVTLLLQKSHQIKRENPASEKSMLIAEDRIYGGVRITFGFVDLPVSTQGFKQIVFKMSHGKVEEHGYNPSEPPEIQ